MLIELRVEPNIYRRERASGVTYKVRMLVAGRPRTHTVDTLAEARRVRGILEAKRAQAAEHGRATSFQRWWEGWIQMQSGAESTRKTYESLAKCHVLPYFGEREVSAPTPVEATSVTPPAGSWIPRTDFISSGPIFHSAAGRTCRWRPADWRLADGSISAGRIHRNCPLTGLWSTTYVLPHGQGVLHEVRGYISVSKVCCSDGCSGLPCCTSRLRQR